MNMKQLKYAILLADLGSFSAAADELGISQPSFSQYIKKIEDQIGMPLFERTNGDIRLTDAGRIYIEYGKKIINLEHRMATEFLDISENKTGSVIIGTSPYRSAGMMPEIAKAFRQKYPGIHLVVEEMVSSELINKMEKGFFDLCMTMLPVDEKLFSYEKILEEEMVLAVPAGFPHFDARITDGRKYPAIDIRKIDGSSVIMITEAQTMQQAINNLCDEYDLQLKKAAVVKSLEAQINMVRKGIGMAIVPTGIERFCNENEVTFYSFTQELPRREVAAIWRKDRLLPKVVTDLLSMIKTIKW